MGGGGGRMGREMGLVLSRLINTWGLGRGGGVAELQAGLLIRSIISINQSINQCYLYGANSN